MRDLSLESLAAPVDPRARVRTLAGRIRRRLAADEGGMDLRNCDVLPHEWLALPLSAPSVQATGRKRDSSVARVARYRGIQLASAGSNALKNERDHKVAALAQAGERDAATAGGRSFGGGSDGAVPGSRGSITCELACPSPRPSHV